MYLYNAPRAKDMTRLDAAWWIADQTGITPDEEDAPLMAWWRQWAAEGGSRHA